MSWFSDRPSEALAAGLCRSRSLDSGGNLLREKAFVEMLDTLRNGIALKSEEEYFPKYHRSARDWAPNVAICVLSLLAAGWYTPPTSATLVYSLAAAAMGFSGVLIYTVFLSMFYRRMTQIISGQAPDGDVERLDAVAEIWKTRLKKYQFAARILRPLSIISSRMSDAVGRHSRRGGEINQYSERLMYLRSALQSSTPASGPSIEAARTTIRGYSDDFALALFQNMSDSDLLVRPGFCSEMISRIEEITSRKTY